MKTKLGCAEIGANAGQPRVRVANFTRRRFLRSSTIAATLGAAPGMSLAEAAIGNLCSAAKFRSVLGSSFQASILSTGTATTMELKLTEVEPAQHARLPDAAFSLRFEVEAPKLEQGTYLLSHPELGEFAALLVPTRNGKALRAEFHQI